MTNRALLDEMLEAAEEVNAEALRYAAATEREKPAIERMVDKAKPPKVRTDGSYVGSAHKPFRKLTEQQKAFVAGLIQGKTQRQAYRDAYPSAEGVSDIFVSAYAAKLVKHPMIIRALEQAADETIDFMLDNQAATRRWVVKQLMVNVASAKQEGTKVRCLELIGRSVGLFREEPVEAEHVPVSADQLKKSLDDHIQILENCRLKPADQKPFTRNGPVTTDAGEAMNEIDSTVGGT